MIHPPDVVGKYLPADKVLGDLGSGGGGEAASAPAAAGDLDAPLLQKRGTRKQKDVHPGEGQVGGYTGACIYCVIAVLIEVVKTIFRQKNLTFNNDRIGLTRSAVFLIVFMIIHAIGNLHVFLGPDDFNGYGYFYVRLYWSCLGIFQCNIVELYVLLCAVLHVMVATKRTLDISVNYTPKSGKLNLAFSGVLLLTYMIIHLQQFRFGDTQPYMLRPPPYMINFYGILHLNLFWTPDTSVTPVPVRDIYRLEFELFQNGYWVWFYVISTIVFAVHMALGWAKATPAPALGIQKRWHTKVTHIGYVIAAFLAAIYISFPLYTHLAPMKTGNLGMQG
jgi:hypothetical protein